MFTECTVTLSDRVRFATQTGVLSGDIVRLEPLEPGHVPGLAAASAADPSLYQWAAVPQGHAGMLAYVTTAIAGRDGGTVVPFAVIRNQDETVIGSSRLWDLEYWQWPGGHRFSSLPGPDVCEIGHTWLTRPAIRTGANTEMKRLMLGLAFGSWRVHRVCLHTDERNARSRAAMERIGARFEGILRGHRMAADQTVRDSARYSVTAAEWPAVQRHLNELASRYSRS
jgi:RimJ/RimL family protein N-acetyltransferase